MSAKICHCLKLVSANRIHQLHERMRPAANGFRCESRVVDQSPGSSSTRSKLGLLPSMSQSSLALSCDGAPKRLAEIGSKSTGTTSLSTRSHTRLVHA